MIQCRAFVIGLLGLIVGTHGLDEVLRGQSVVYGVAALAAGAQNKSLCHQELNSFYKAVDEKHVWALKVLDASGRPRSGFLFGNNLWLGSHAFCSEISNRKKMEINYDKIPHRQPTEYDYPPFQMAFVMAYAKHNNSLQAHTQLPLETTIQVGLCVPKVCAKESSDLQHLLAEYFDMNYLKMQELYDVHMEVTAVKPLHDNGGFLLAQPKFIIFMAVVCVTLLLTLVGTVYDVHSHNAAKLHNRINGHNGSINGKLGATSVSVTELVATSTTDLKSIEPGTMGRLLKCFSIYSNTKALVRTKLPQDAVGCIHGLRFFGMFWVIMIHSVFYQADYISNVPYAYRLSEDLAAQILSNSTYSVDTYLFLSGFLLSYLFFKSKRNQNDGNVWKTFIKKTLQFCLMCVQRFMRLTPPYVVTILATDVLYTFYRQTSALHSSEFPDEVCSKYWWRNVLYINNLYPRTEMCLSWSWYLSLDTQFFTLGAFLLILSTVAFKIAAAATIVVIALNIAATTYKSYSIKYIPTMDEQLTQLDAIYDLPWHRLGPYFVGIITAYFLLVKLNKSMKIKERTRIILWILFPMLNLWILFTLYTRNLSVEFSAVYMGVSRTLWGVGLGWLLVACCTGNARALDKFLSFRGWIPLSRLTYCAYLLNPLVANMVYLGSESSYSSSKASFALTILGITAMTFHISFLFSMLFESPFILLTKMLFNRLARERRNDNTSTASCNTSQTSTA